MNRLLHNNLIAQYKINEVSGMGGVSFESDVRCVLPEIVVPNSSSSTYALVGKNILPNNYFKGKTQTINGVTFKANADGSVLVNGTASANAIFTLYNLNSPNTIYRAYMNRPWVISGTPKGGGTTTYSLWVRIINEATGEESYQWEAGKGRKVSITGKLGNAYIQVTKGCTVNNILFRPQIEFGTEVTDFEEHYHGGSVSAATASTSPLLQPPGVANLLEIGENAVGEIKVKYVTHS